MPALISEVQYILYTHIACTSTLDPVVTKYLRKVALGGQGHINRALLNIKCNVPPRIGQFTFSVR